jgi:hypothetical protein
MISIKDACRHAKHLTSLETNIKFMVRSENNYITTKQIHLKSKSDSSMQDEEIVAELPRAFTCKMHDIAFLLKDIIDEKLRLSSLVNKAKRENLTTWTEDGRQLGVDEAIEYSISLRALANEFLSNLANYKVVNMKTFENSFRINNEGTQVPFRYPVEIVKELDFDRNIVASQKKIMIDKADRISAAVDAVMSAPTIDYEPKYGLYDTVDEILASYRP